jgi:hypothetical protein
MDFLQAQSWGYIKKGLWTGKLVVGWSRESVHQSVKSEAEDQMCLMGDLVSDDCGWLTVI